MPPTGGGDAVGHKKTDAGLFYRGGLASRRWCTMYCPIASDFCFSIDKDKMMTVAASQYVCRPLHMSACASQNSRSSAEVKNNHNFFLPTQLDDEYMVHGTHDYIRVRGGTPHGVFRPLARWGASRPRFLGDLQPAVVGFEIKLIESKL